MPHYEIFGIISLGSHSSHGKPIKKMNLFRFFKIIVVKNTTLYDYIN